MARGISESEEETSRAALTLEVTVLGLEELAALRVFGVAAGVFGLLGAAAVRLA